MPSVDVQFVLAPFLPRNLPALGVSYLTSILRLAGHIASIHYLNVDLAKQIGSGLSQFVEESFTGDLLVGEMIFTPALWGHAAVPWSDYEPIYERTMSKHRPEFFATSGGEIISRLKSLRERTPAIIERWADLLLEESPAIVAFSSTFEQNIASLALARRIKEKGGQAAPYIVMGGANCEAEMGEAIANNFPFIDTVVSGEGEHVILDIVRRRLSGKPVERYIRGPAVRDMDALPLPDFSDYFRALEGDAGLGDVVLPVEASRGCWWGEKSLCTFCGLNGNGLAYRSKTPERFAGELKELRKRHQRNYFFLTDNIIDMKYFKTAFPALAADPEGFRLGIEVKANLRADQVETMALAGVAQTNPGIESLSTAVLRIMKKGTTLLQNLQHLKWSMEAGIYPLWYIIYGFPGEDEGSYREMLELIPSLVHFTAPITSSQIHLDRFSEYWRAPEKYSLKNLRQAAGYDFIYPALPPSERMRLAYAFNFEYEDGEKIRPYFNDVDAAAKKWQEQYVAGAVLQLEKGEDGFAIKDTRTSKDAASVPISPLEYRLLQAFDGRIGAEKATQIVSSEFSACTQHEISRAIEKLTAEKWIIGESGIFVSLVLDYSRRERIERERAGLRAAACLKEEAA